jgi:hypothetical protein
MLLRLIPVIATVWLSFSRPHGLLVALKKSDKMNHEDTKNTKEHEEKKQSSSWCVLRPSSRLFVFFVFFVVRLVIFDRGL